MNYGHLEPDTTSLHPDELKLARQHSGQQGPEGEGVGQEAIGEYGIGSYGLSGQQGYDPTREFFDESKSYWLAFEGLETEGPNPLRDEFPYGHGLDDTEDFNRGTGDEPESDQAPPTTPDDGDDEDPDPEKGANVRRARTDLDVLDA